MMEPSDYLLNSTREYSVYVCEARAIPRVCDGLKDGQRKALWLLRNRAEKMKTFSLGGLLGYERLYVHGETSANNAISLLAAPFCNNVPLIHGEGQFGTRIAPVEGIGAPRYTEVRRSKAAEHLLYRDLELVPLRDNYDGSTQEPVQFLPIIPIVLLNGISGVAVGWSTEIMPRDIRRLITATQQAIDGKKPIGLEPHFSYLDVDVTPGSTPNAWIFTGKATVVDTSTVHIAELPPGLSIENFRKRLNKLEDENAIDGYTDRSTERIDITVRFKRGTIKEWTAETAIDFFRLRQQATERIVVIDWEGSHIRQYTTAAELVVDFANWRLGWYTKRYERLLAAANYELRGWLALHACFQAKLPARLTRFADRQALEIDVRTITKDIGIDDKQLDHIVSLPTYRWTKDYEKIVTDAITKARSAIAEYTAILASPERVRHIFRDELEDLKKIKF